MVSSTLEQLAETCEITSLHKIGSARLAALWLAQLAIYALTSGPLAYGTMSDEYYYLDCASRLAWGYVDHPPLAPALLALVRALFGTSLYALHLLPMLAACANWLLLALLARELGGGRVAQSLAAIAGFAAPVYQAVAGFYSMNAFEPAIWTASAWLLARIANGECAEKCTVPGGEPGGRHAARLSPSADRPGAARSRHH